LVTGINMVELEVEWIEERQLKTNTSKGKLLAGYIS